MAAANDFFFAPHQKPSQRRRYAALSDGLYHGSRIRPLDPAPDQLVTLAFSANEHLAIERVAVYYTTDGSTPEGARGVPMRGSVVLAEPGERAHDEALDLPVREWHATLPGQLEGTLVRYRAEGWSERKPEMRCYADAVDPLAPAPAQGRIFAYSVDRFQVPAWFREAIIYHVYVDRFAAAHDEPPLRDPGAITSFFGGTLRGIVEKLDYISALGASCLWLSPVFESPSAHGYNPSSYADVARRFGTNEDLRRLIDEAHQRGMRVLLDFVASHTSDEHPLFQEALRDLDGPAAAHYAFDSGQLGYRAYMDRPDMPQLDTERPEVQRYLIASALHWLSHFGADGLRLDFVPGPTHAFWAMFQREVKRRFPDALTIGEVTETPEGLATYAGRMDAVMDFPLAGLLRRVFALRTAPLAELMAELDARAAESVGLARSSLLDNHDMHRFLWLAEGDRARLRLAAACQLTLPGASIIYYGTEVGLSQERDAYLENAYARAPMLWGEAQDRDLLAYYQRLLALRRAHPALRGGLRRTLPVTAAGAATAGETETTESSARQVDVGAYLCQQGDDLVVVALNNERQAIRVDIALPAWTAGRQPEVLLAPADRHLHAHEGVIELALPPVSAVIVGLR